MRFLSIAIILLLTFLLLFDTFPQFHHLVVLFFGVGTSLEFRGLVVQHDQVPSPDVEARQMVDGGLGIVNVLVHDERRPLRVLALIAEPNLIHGTVLAENPVQFLGRDLEGQIPNVQYTIHLRGQS